MIVKTEAVVLRSMKYRETSRIVTFYTKAFGKVAGIVKGARSPKNIYGSALQPMSHVGLVLYKKEGRDLHAVSQCDLLESYRSLSEELPKMAAGMTIIELVANIAHEEEENEPLFDALLGALSAANRTGRDPVEKLFQFQVRLAGILGFKPVFDQCVSCGKDVPNSAAEIRFELDRGGPLCSKCRLNQGETLPISGKELHFLAALEDVGEGEEFAMKALDARAQHAIGRLLDSFFGKHVTGIRPSRSGRVFSSLISNS